jgi:hypothetical protein
MYCTISNIFIVDFAYGCVFSTFFRASVAHFLKYITFIFLIFMMQVFAFGSVPLKTYLPDGDIDITVLSNTWLNSSLIDDVRYVLNSEMDNPDAEFEVKDLHFIDADVSIPASAYYVLLIFISKVVETHFLFVLDGNFRHFSDTTLLCFLSLTRLSSLNVSSRILLSTYLSTKLVGCPLYVFLSWYAICSIF